LAAPTFCNRWVKELQMSGSMQSVGPVPARVDNSKNGCLRGVKSLVANNVYDAEGNFIGKLEEIVIDTRTGCVRHAVLAVGGVMGVGRRRLAVPWSALTPDANSQRCIVDVTQMQLTAVWVSKSDPWLQRTDSTAVGESFSRPSRAFGAKG
jgi:PRC-barrel domain protein